MIRNERQFRVTTAQRARLARELQQRPSAEVPEWVAQAGRAAVESQLRELDAELDDYVALRDGGDAGFKEVRDLNELPRALIRARIASHLTQRDLAERLQLKEQQIQKYEATDYAGASVARLNDVMRALGVSFRGEVALSASADRSASLRKQLRDLGLSQEVLNRRIFGGRSNLGVAETLGVEARAARIFGIESQAAEKSAPRLKRAASFRAPAFANRRSVSGYAQYAEYLAGLLVRACVREFRPLPGVESIRSSLGSALQEAPLESLLAVCWEHGVPVLPLADAGTFHGACWWFDGRPAIALKHGFRSADRWAFLLAHEMNHARSEPNVDVLEEDLPVRAWREQPTEQDADASASQLLLGDRAEAMLQVAIETAGRDVSRLKSVVPAVAEAGNVSVGLFADYVATRVNSETVNWWPTANNLHQREPDPWRATRNALFGEINLLRLDPLDREILVDGVGV